MSEQLGRYEILEEIGEGGFAIVYRGRDTALDRQVALKELRPILLQDKSWIKRFRREARTIARLDHPNIVPIYDVYDTQNRLFIVMRLVDGPSLEDLISRRGNLPWQETLQIITAIAGGLDYAHAQGVLHRDLKPANILIDDNRGPMLSDFGLAKLTGEASMSASGSVVGTPHYIAPEVWEGRGTTNQSDIYALGCILYEMLTGEKVFKGDTPPAVMMAHFRPVELPNTWPEGVPPNVSPVLTTALANAPAERYATAAQLVTALTHLSAAKAAPEALPEQSPKPPEATGPPPQSQESVEPATTAPSPEPIPAEPAAPQSVAPEQKAKPVPAQPSPPGHPAMPASPHAERRPRRFGCFWISAVVVFGLVLLAVVSIGGVCSTVGSFFDSLPTVEVGSSRTQEIRVPLPADADETELEIDFGPGILTIQPGATEALVLGTATYNAPQLEPKVTVDQDSVRLEPDVGVGLAGFTTENLKNEWDLTLVDTPMALTINATGADGDVELGGLALNNLTINNGAANFNLSFSEPNKIAMDKLSYNGGATNAFLTGLANARADDVAFTGGAGSYTLDFSGRLQNSFDVTIEGGLGTISIVVPDDVPTRLTIEGTMANISARDEWQQSGERYILNGAAGQEYSISFEVNMGPGNIELRNR